MLHHVSCVCSADIKVVFKKFCEFLYWIFIFLGALPHCDKEIDASLPHRCSEQLKWDEIKVLEATSDNDWVVFTKHYTRTTHAVVRKRISCFRG